MPTLDLPAIHVGGWYDVHLAGILQNFTGMQRQAPTERARQAQRLVVGPWAHWTPLVPVVGDIDFGPEATFNPTRMRLDWFRHWLQEGPIPDWAPVRIFVMGENRWRDEQEWPLARTRYTPWYLGQGGRLGPSEPAGGGAGGCLHLRPSGPGADPRRPPAGHRRGGRAGRTVPARPSGPTSSTYTSEPLGAPMEVTGPLWVDLWAATDVPDTDFTAVLVDVHPDGRGWNLSEGAVRARHSGTPTPLVAGAVYRFTVDLIATSAVVPAGHRLRLHISSSSFPEWEPNPNTGRPVGTDTDADVRTARQQVFHDALHPSHVVLPVIPASA